MRCKLMFKNRSKDNVADVHKWHYYHLFTQIFVILKKKKTIKNLQNQF